MIFIGVLTRINTDSVFTKPFCRNIVSWAPPLSRGLIQGLRISDSQFVMRCLASPRWCFPCCSVFFGWCSKILCIVLRESVKIHACGWGVPVYTTLQCSSTVVCNVALAYRRCSNTVSFATSTTACLQVSVISQWPLQRSLNVPWCIFQLWNHSVSWLECCSVLVTAWSELQRSG